jgi:hypothetical protein
MSKVYLRYFLLPHPDDEMMAWSIVQAQAEVYPVFMLMTRGERTSFCDMHGLQTSMGERIPNGSTCVAKRMDSWHEFLNRQKQYDTLLDTNAEMQYKGVMGNPPFELWVGPQSARVAFDLGDGNLTSDEVINAVTTFRNSGLPLLPVRRELDVIAAGYYNATDTSAGIYTHADHKAVHSAVFNHDFGTPGRQFGRTSHGDPDYLSDGIKLYVAPGIYTENMEVGPTGQRLGDYQQVYGWLAEQEHSHGETDADAGGLSREQCFWLRY